MRGSRGANGVGASNAKPRSRARRLCALACALAVLVAVSLGSDRSASPLSPSDREDASSSRAPNLDAVTGGGTGVSPALGERPAVAVYFTGQARTLRRTLCSVRRHIFDPLMEQGFAPVVFVAGERDADAEEYASLLGRIPGVELGDVLIVDRPEASPRSEETVKYEDLPEPDDDAALPAVPRACVDAFRRKGRWFHAGGDGSDEGSKNARYSEEVLSQLWYRSVVDRLRRRWERTERGKKAGSFRWIVVPRPDNVYVDDLPDLRAARGKVQGDVERDLAGDVGDFVSFDASDASKGPTVQGTVFVPTWGEGYDPHAGGGVWGYFFGSKTSAKKRRAGVNNRFSYGGVAAMSAYHDLYARMCHDGLAQDMPAGVNFEQMVNWYFERPATFAAGVRRALPIPDDFWFLRLRRGDGATPVENPGHEPAMVSPTWGRTGAGLRNARPGAPGAEIVDDKRWEVWTAAAKEVWRCDDAASGAAGAASATARGECLVREMRKEWKRTAWLRKIVPFSGWVRRMAMPGGWLEGSIRRRCG